MITKQISRFVDTLVSLPIFYHFLFICLLYKSFGAGGFATKVTFAHKGDNSSFIYTDNIFDVCHSQGYF